MFKIIAIIDINVEVFYLCIILIDKIWLYFKKNTGIDRKIFYIVVEFVSLIIFVNYLKISNTIFVNIYLTHTTEDFIFISILNSRVLVETNNKKLFDSHRSKFNNFLCV